MTWNYRVVFKDGVYGIHECFYDEPHEKWGMGHLPYAWSKNSIVPYAEESDQGLYQDLVLMLQATTKPTLIVKEDGNGNEWLEEMV